MLSRDEAYSLLCEYNKEPFHIHHAETVEGVMRWFANQLGYGEDADFWATVGLLHDLDFEMYPEQHCTKCVEIMRLMRSSFMPSQATAGAYAPMLSRLIRWRRSSMPPTN